MIVQIEKNYLFMNKHEKIRVEHWFPYYKNLIVLNNIKIRIKKLCEVTSN